MKSGGNFMEPVVFKKPVGVKFKLDEKVDVIAREFNLRENSYKPGPGRYETYTDFE